jgi:hypothetical protein
MPNTNFRWETYFPKELFKPFHFLHDNIVNILLLVLISFMLLSFIVLTGLNTGFGNGFGNGERKKRVFVMETLKNKSDVDNDGESGDNNKKNDETSIGTNKKNKKTAKETKAENGIESKSASTEDNFCNKYLKDTDKLNIRCGGLSKNRCSKTNCCAYVKIARDKDKNDRPRKPQHKCVGYNPKNGLDDNDRFVGDFGQARENDNIKILEYIHDGEVYKI